MLLAAFLLVFVAPAGDALPPVGTIDFYGLRTISEGDARRPLALKEGDSFPLDDESLRRTLTEARQRLVQSLGVAEARIEVVCCEAGKLILYVGIDEKGTSPAHRSAEPQGTKRLPGEILGPGAAFGDALILAVEAGDAAEDDTAGHSLSHDPAVRSIQRRFIALAADNAPLLRDVLHHSADAEHRALAAQVLAYAPDKRAIVDDLVEAAQDPAPEVRNNATRALLVMAGAGFSIPAQPFIPGLSSIEWTDRNKASGLLAELTTARAPAVLSRLCEEALPALTEMARWKSAGHAYASFFILGRIAGLPENDIEHAWAGGRREEVIAKVSRCTPGPTPSP